MSTMTIYYYISHAKVRSTFWQWKLSIGSQTMQKHSRAILFNENGSKFKNVTSPKLNLEQAALHTSR